MKKTLCAILIFIICMSVIACGNNLETVENAIQGTWVRVEEVNSTTEVTITFDKGSISRTQTIGEDSSTLTGVYTINSEGQVVVSYTDGSSQTFLCYITETGHVLTDASSGVSYQAKK